MNALRVEIWSDIACPWCWVGKRHFEAARARFQHPVEVLWRSFELDPTAPRSVDRVEYGEALARKLRVPREAALAMVDRMTRIGAADGLEFRFDRAQPGNTFDAHRLLCWAAERGRQGDLKERLFKAYMNEGRSVADHDELVAFAAEVGLSAEDARAVLAEGQYADEVRAEEALAGELGITGVPCFVIGERYAISGAQPAEVLLQAMQHAWDEAQRDAQEVIQAVTGGKLGSDDVRDEAVACGPDGCALPSS